MALRISKITRWRNSRFVRFRPAQVKIAIAQPSLFGCVHFFFNLEWRRLRVVQDVQARRDHFYFASGDFWIRFLAANHAAFHCDYEFGAKLLGFCVRFGVELFIEHDLSNSSAVAKIDEDQLAEIAPAMDPAHEHDVFIGVGGAEGATIICAFQISESFEQFCRPFFGLSAIAAAAISVD